MRRRPTGLEPAPGRGLLLGDADHHHAEPPLPLGLLHVAAGDELLGLALLEMHHRDSMPLGEPFDRPDVRVADLPERRRRGNRKPPVQQKPNHLPLGLQLRQVPREEDPIDRVDLERHPLPK
jgi:hypothetical protein